MAPTTVVLFFIAKMTAATDIPSAMMTNIHRIPRFACSMCFSSDVINAERSLCMYVFPYDDDDDMFYVSVIGVGHKMLGESIGMVMNAPLLRDGSSTSTRVSGFTSRTVQQSKGDRHPREYSMD